MCACRSGLPSAHPLPHRRATASLAPYFFHATYPQSTISSLASAFGDNVQQYADDTQLHIDLTASDAATDLSWLSSCLSALHNWLCHNGLALNSSQPESILVRTRRQLHNFPTDSPPSISGSAIQISQTIKILGVILDNQLTLKQHTISLLKYLL